MRSYVEKQGWYGLEDEVLCGEARLVWPGCQRGPTTGREAVAGRGSGQQEARSGAEEGFRASLFLP
eukprot:scaffold53835_cov57-Phaeocystis_antarctica.AAC.4